MRQLLSTAVSAVLLCTTACVSEPIIVRPASSEATASSPADARAGATRQAVAAPGIPAGWKRVSSAEGGFSAAFPGTPEFESTDVDSGFGKARNLTYGVAPESDGIYLAVLVTKFPAGLDGLAHSDEMLKGAREGALKQAQGRLLTEKEVTVEGSGSGGKRSYPGLEYEALGPNGVQFVVRIIIAEDRMLQLMFVNKDEERALFDQFLSTFSLQ